MHPDDLAYVLQELVHYLRHVRDIWLYIVGDLESVALVNLRTVKSTHFKRILSI